MAKRSVATFTTTIHRSPQVVFDYIAEIGKHAEWSPKPFRVEGSSGRVNVGDTFTSIGTILGDNNPRNEVTVTECSPPRRLVLDSLEKGEHFINSFELEPVGSGTRLTRTTDAPKPPNRQRDGGHRWVGRAICLSADTRWLATMVPRGSISAFRDCRRE